MFFIDFIPGDKETFLLFNLDTKEITELKDSLELSSEFYDKKLFCFDLYKMKSYFGNTFPFVFDIQSLFNLNLKKPESIEDLFDKNKSLKYFHLKGKLLSNLNSYRIAKIKVKDFSLKELVSPELLQEFFNERLNCISETLKSVVFDKNIIDYYVDETTVQALHTLLQLSDKSILVNNKVTKFEYNFFGSKNSRLSLRNKDFNIYNLPKDKRSCIKAPEGFMLAQFDYKSFQPRIALSLFASDTIKIKIKDVEDIYSIFPGDRESNKIELISWMFSNRRNIKFDQLLSSMKDARYKLWQASKDGKLSNSFKRPLFFTGEEENVVFQNFICSVEADSILRVLSAVDTQLLGRKSTVLFPFYDCLICLIHKDEIDKIYEIKETMEKYLYKHFYTYFPVSIKVGKDLGTLEEYALSMEVFSSTVIRKSSEING